MRKSILRFGALALMSLMSISAFAEGVVTFEAIGNKGEYSVNEDDQTVTLVKANAATSTIPAVVQNSDRKSFTVTAIGTKAFWDTEEGKAILEGVEIADATGMTIKSSAFYGVKNLTIDLSKLAKIEDYAFYNELYDKSTKAYTPLNFVTVGTGTAPVVLEISQIGKNAFQNTNLVAVKWAGGLQIPDGCFKDCSSLTHFIYAERDFGNASNIKSIGASAFEGCSSLAYFGWTLDNTNYYVPGMLTTIGDKAFKGCEALTNLGYPTDVALRITTVGKLAFEGCKALTSNDFNIFAKAESFGSGAFRNCTGSNFTIINIPTGVTALLSENVGTQATPDIAGVFQGCTNLQTVNFHKDFETLGANVFNGCTSLVTLGVVESGKTFKDTKITSIPDGAFRNTNFTQIDLREGITSIGKYAFYESKLASVIFPASLETIDEYAFAKSGSLATVTITGQKADGAAFRLADKVECTGKITRNDAGTITENLADKAFENIKSGAVLNVPYGCHAMYTDTDQEKNPSWRNFADVKQALAGYISNEKFWVGGLCYQVTNNSATGDIATVKVVDGLYIKGNVSDDTSGSTEADKKKKNEQEKNWKGHQPLSGTITIPQYVTTEYDRVSGSKAFYKVTGLEEVNTAELKSGEKLTDVAKEIAKVTAVTINAANIYVPAIFNADRGFTALKEFQTGGTGSIAGIKYYDSTESDYVSATKAFEGCTQLSTFNVKADDTFTEIPDNTFKGCELLANPTIPTKVTSIGKYAFSGCKALGETVALPTSLTSIGQYAFDGSSIVSIDIPKKVRNIGQYAFNYIYDNTKDTPEYGVKNVYVNWTEDDFTDGTNPLDFETNISNKAFGDVLVDGKSSTNYYRLRNLYYPAGETDYYLGNSTAIPAIPGVVMFKTTSNLFRTLEGIQVNGKNVPMTAATSADDYPSITLYDRLPDAKGDLTELVTELRIANDISARITYERYVTPESAGHWQCWYVPFEVKAGSVLGATFAQIFDTELNGNNVTIELKELQTGDKVKANTCYVVKFDESGTKDIEASSFMLYKTPDSGSPKTFSVSCATTEFTFTGLYKSVTAENNNDFYFVNSDGNFQNIAKGGVVPAYRFTMKSKNRSDNPYNVKFVVLDDEDATGIESINAESLTAPMFDLMGRQITSPAKGQVYIQNGVKKLAR